MAAIVTSVIADIGWGWGEAGFWMLLAVVVLVAVGFALFVITRSGDEQEAAPADSPPAAPPPPAAAEPEPEPRHVTERDVVAVVTFPHPERAEHAFAEARAKERGAAWLEEVAFVEAHRHGRIVMRGTFAGHYLDVDDVGDVTGQDTAAGALTGVVRADIPEGSSAIVVLGPPADADAMSEALAGHGGRPTRHELTRETAQAFDALLARAPRASHHVS